MNIDFSNPELDRNEPIVSATLLPKTVRNTPSGHRFLTEYIGQQEGEAEPIGLHTSGAAAGAKR
jgi:hypothetical protein